MQAICNLYVGDGHKTWIIRLGNVGIVGHAGDLVRGNAIKMRKIFYWALIAFIIFLIIALIQKILGGSLGFEEIVVGLLIANLGYSFYLNSKFSEHVGWHKGSKGEGEQ
jgi:hypothetical protein